MDVWEYFASRDRELREQSAVWEAEPYPYSAEMGSGDQRGTIYGRAKLTERAFVSIHEIVQVTGSGITRVKYAYYLLYDNQELWAEERDPTHAPAVHRHDRHHRRYPSSVMSFNEFLTKAWTVISAEEELRTLTEDDPSEGAAAGDLGG